jgi:glycosyl transferase family 2
MHVRMTKTDDRGATAADRHAAFASTVRALWERAFYRRTSLGHLLERTNLPADTVPPARATADAPIVFELRAPPRALLEVEAAVEGEPGARARCEAAVVAGAKPRSRAFDVTAESPWRRLRLPLGAAAGRIVRVELRASVEKGRAASAVVRWREPTLRWRRTAADVWRSLVVGVTAHGLAGLIRRTHSATLSLDRRRRDFDKWRRRRTPDEAALARMKGEAASLTGPTFAVIVSPAGDFAGLARTMASLDRQVYARSEAHVCGDASACNDAVARSGADFVLSVSAGDVLTPHALFALARALNEDPQADVIYSDEAVVDEDGAVLPRFKPDWSPDYLLARMYVGRLLAMRRTAIRAAGGYRSGFDGAIEYDLLLRIAKPTRPDEARVAHVADILCEGRQTDTAEGAGRRALEAFCRSAGMAAIVTPGTIRGVWRVRRAHEHPPVTLIVPTDARVGDTPSGREPLVAYCVRSLLERTDYDRFEILLVHSAPLPAEVDEALADPRCRRLQYDAAGAFNFSRTINAAVAATSTPVVALLNDDVEPIDAEWLSAMLEYALQERIGAVGAKLFYPDGRLQHVGVATGVCGVAAHLLHQHPGGSLACDGIAASVRNCSAVTGACLMTRRAVYDQVGGFDERLASDFNDVDFCLRTRRAGYRIVYTPYARLYHHESATFGARRQQPADVERVRRIWGDALMHDPYYNANLSRAFADCRLDV